MRQALWGLPTHRWALKPGPSKEGGDPGSTSRPLCPGLGRQGRGLGSCDPRRQGGDNIPYTHTHTPLHPSRHPDTAPGRRVGNSPVTLATAAAAAMTQQFWFRCAHPSSPISAKGPEVLPAASCAPAGPHRRQDASWAAPQHPDFCKPLTKAEVRSYDVSGWTAAATLPPGRPKLGPSCTREPHPLPSLRPQPPTPIPLSHGMGRAGCSKHKPSQRLFHTSPSACRDSSSPGQVWILLLRWAVVLSGHLTPRDSWGAARRPGGQPRPPGAVKMQEVGREGVQRTPLHPKNTYPTPPTTPAGPAGFRSTSQTSLN